MRHVSLFILLYCFPFQGDVGGAGRSRLNG
jgi:hypothetical protein